MASKKPIKVFSSLLNNATQTSEIIRKKHQIIEKKKAELSSIVEKYNSQDGIILFRGLSHQGQVTKKSQCWYR